MTSVEGENRGHTKHIVKIDLAVCILFYEKWEQTTECIQSFLPSGVNIYILNNGSSPPARQTLGRFCNEYRQITIFDSNVNLGVGVGRNYLITHTTEKWLFFVDNDITIKTPDWLQRFTRYAFLCTDVEVFIPRLFEIPKYRYHTYLSMRIVGDIALFDKKSAKEFTNYFPGGASLVNRKLFNRLGLYDENMFTGAEDHEISIRGIRLGNPVNAQLTYDIELIHDHRPVKKREDRNAVLVRYDTNLIETSFNRITEKHCLIHQDYSKTGIANIVEEMLKKDDLTFKKDWKHSVSNQAKRILRQNSEMAVSFASSMLPYRAKEILKQILHHTPIPLQCSLFMTDRCNFKCPESYRSVIGIKKSKEMTLATVQKLLSLYPSLDAFRVTGLGEPTLCPDFVDIVNFLKKNGKFVGVITNGTNTNTLLELTYELNYISISLK